MAKPQAFLQRIGLLLGQIEGALLDLANEVRIDYNSWRNGEHVVVIAPDYSWGELDQAQKAKRIAIHRKWEEWKEHFLLMLAKLPDAERRPANESIKSLDDWVAFEGWGWSLSNDRTQNARKIEDRFDSLRKTLDLLGHTGEGGTIVVPDTNAIIRNPDVIDYEVFGGGEQVTVAFLPTVLGELDELKVNHRNEDFRRKVEGVINRLKEYRRRGDVVEGVKGAGKVQVRFVAADPRFDHTLSWLDPQNKDDRIIAATMELQRENPSAVLILITGDINHQNKAEAALLPHAELP